jgi:hypothetical protein
MMSSAIYNTFLKIVGVDQQGNTINRKSGNVKNKSVPYFGGRKIKSVPSLY